MKYCSQCGKELVDEAVVCPNCGCAVQAPVSQQEDKPSTGLNILAFLFPLVGLILFLCFQFFNYQLHGLTIRRQIIGLTGQDV